MRLPCDAWRPAAELLFNPRRAPGSWWSGSNRTHCTRRLSRTWRRRAPSPSAATRRRARRARSPRPRPQRLAGGGRQVRVWLGMCRRAALHGRAAGCVRAMLCVRSQAKRRRGPCDGCVDPAAVVSAATSRPPPRPVLPQRARPPRRRPQRRTRRTSLLAWTEPGRGPRCMALRAHERRGAWQAWSRCHGCGNRLNKGGHRRWLTSTFSGHHYKRRVGHRRRTGSMWRQMFARAEDAGAADAPAVSPVEEASTAAPAAADSGSEKAASSSEAPSSSEPAAEPREVWGAVLRCLTRRVVMHDTSSSALGTRVPGRWEREAGAGDQITRCRRDVPDAAPAAWACAAGRSDADTPAVLARRRRGTTRGASPPQSLPAPPHAVARTGADAHSPRSRPPAECRGHPGSQG